MRWLFYITHRKYENTTFYWEKNEQNCDNLRGSEFVGQFISSFAYLMRSHVRRQELRARTMTMEDAIKSRLRFNRAHSMVILIHWPSSNFYSSVRGTLRDTHRNMCIMETDAQRTGSHEIVGELFHGHEIVRIISLIPRLSHRLSYSTFRTISWSWNSSTNYFMARALRVRSES